MEVEIRALTPALLNDYLYFFDNVAFADHREWSGCYCMHFHWQPRWDDEPPRSSRDRAIEHIRSGALRGYLAYAGGSVVGWCNANDKRSYSGLAGRKEIWEEDEAERRIKSVVCFLVAPDMRAQGIATRLLERVCADAAADGYDAIEAYPPSGARDEYAAHHGTVPLYEKQGFSIYRTFPDDGMMRKYIRAGQRRGGGSR